MPFLNLIFYEIIFFGILERRLTWSELTFLIPPEDEWEYNDDITISLMDKNYASDELNSSC